jgi:cytochrome b561
LWRIENTRSGYGLVAVLFHWTMAALIIALSALGLYMVRLPDVGFSTEKIVLILFHKQLGMLALALVALRWLWRMCNLLPELVEHLPDWQKIIARFVHLSFYALMFALPLTGWLMSSAAGIPVSFFGLFTLPDPIARDDALFRTLIEVHKVLGYLMLALIFVHASAALRHHFGFRDDTLRRMWPGCVNRP